MPIETAVGNINKPSAAHWRVYIGENTSQPSIVSIDKISFEKLAANVALGCTQAKLAHGLHQRLFHSFLKFVQPNLYFGIRTKQFQRPMINRKRNDGRCTKTQQDSNIVSTSSLTGGKNHTGVKTQSLVN